MQPGLDRFVETQQKLIGYLVSNPLIEDLGEGLRSLPLCCGQWLAWLALAVVE
jgi:hypothetical protein